jgi:NAD(P)-dependent dehydrogenase (short-subunit alcohol dehydrogenase family)
MASSSALNSVRFDGRVVITGAGTGMGREHALFLGRLGAVVVLNDLNAEAVEVVADAINTTGGTAVAVAGLIAERAVAASLVRAAVAGGAASTS